MHVPKDKAIAMISMTVMMGLSGLGFFIWMAAEGWADVHGLAVAIILVASTVLQALFAFYWWRRVKGMNDYSVTDHELRDLNSKSTEAKAL